MSFYHIWLDKSQPMSLNYMQFKVCSNIRCYERQATSDVLTASVGVFFNLLLSTFIVDNLYLLLLLRNVNVNPKTITKDEFQCAMIQNLLHCSYASKYSNPNNHSDVEILTFYVLTEKNLAMPTKWHVPVALSAKSNLESNLQQCPTCHNTILAQ